MSTSKHINKICIAVIAIIFILVILIMNMANTDSSSSKQTLGYENRLFNNETVHKIDIVMNDWDSFLETCENEDYSACTVLIDGEKYKNIGIRAKGNTSLSNVKSMGSQRYSFKLEFDQYETGKSYYGLDKLCLNNLIQDNTMMKDYLVYQMMDSFGVDAPLCSYVYITVNGEDWGLYLAVEGVEDSFLQRNYGSETGELYKPDSMSFGGGRGNGKEFDMKKFEQEKDDSDSENTTDNSDNSDFPEPPDMSNMPDMSDMPTPPDMNEMPDMSDMPTPPDMNEMSDVSQETTNSQETDTAQTDDASQAENADKDADKSQRPGMPGGAGGFGGMGSDDVKLKYIDDDSDSYSNIFDSAKTDISKADKKRLIAALKNLSEYTDLENTLDIEEVLRYFVVHNFVVNGDSYTGSMIHNYYLHEKDGQLGMIPWDYNLAFGTFQSNEAASSVNASIDNPVSGGDNDDRPMVGWIFSDEKYTEQYHKLFSAFLEEWIEIDKLTQMIETTAALIRPYVEKDPTKFCTTDEFDTGVSAISRFVTLRGEAITRQLNGDETAVAADDLNISDMGTMNMGKDRNFGNRNMEEQSSDNTENKENFTPPSNMPDTQEINIDNSKMNHGNRQFSNNRPDTPFPGETQEASQANQWILVGSSAVILLLGLIIAIKKKY